MTDRDRERGDMPAPTMGDRTLPTAPEPARDPAPHTTCDVAVVGWGPVGMVTAALLAQRGLTVTVVERWPTRYGLSRAGHFDGETMRTFQGLGIAEQIELVSRPMLMWSLVDAQMDLLATIRLGEGGTSWRESYLSYQPETESIFERRALELGVNLNLGMEVVRLEQHANDVRLTVVPSLGDKVLDATDERVIDAKYLIGADGAHSFVRRTVGIKRLDLGFRAMDELVIDFEHHDSDHDMPELPEVYQVLDPDRPLLAGRWSGPRHSRFEFGAMEGETREWLEREETAWQLLRRWNLTPSDGRIARHGVYSFESRVAERWRDGRVLLVGDAAHTMPPFMGQGMCSGVRDALNLAWKLPEVLAGRADDALLDTYESERRPHVETVIEMSVAVADMCLMRDHEQARERDAALRAGRLPVPPSFPPLGTGVTRGEQRIGRTDSRPSPQGRGALHGRVERLDDFHPGAWTVVSRLRVPTEIFNERQLEVLEHLGVQFVHIARGAGDDYYIDLDGDYDLWFRGTGNKAMLIRPDHYVFGAVAANDDLPALVDELADTLAGHGWHLPEPATPAHV